VPKNADEKILFAIQLIQSCNPICARICMATRRSRTLLPNQAIHPWGPHTLYPRPPSPSLFTHFSNLLFAEFGLLPLGFLSVFSNRVSIPAVTGLRLGRGFFGGFQRVHMRLDQALVQTPLQLRSR